MHPQHRHSDVVSVATAKSASGGRTQGYEIEHTPTANSGFPHQMVDAETRTNANSQRKLRAQALFTSEDEQRTARAQNAARMAKDRAQTKQKEAEANQAANQAVQRKRAGKDLVQSRQTTLPFGNPSAEKAASKNLVDKEGDKTPVSALRSRRSSWAGCCAWSRARTSRRT